MLTSSPLQILLSRSKPGPQILTVELTLLTKCYYPFLPDIVFVSTQYSIDRILPCLYLLTFLLDQSWKTFLTFSVNIY